jgi:type I restriction enzyme S subunit
VKPKRDDVLFSNIGSVGDAARVTDEVEFSIKNIALFRPDPQKVDALYFYYLVVSPYFRAHFLNVRSGSAQPFISLENFRSLKFKYLSDREAQHSVGQILSAYDNLIENNQRRVKLLEQAARLLYKEWFVHIRFPGHEHVTITDGVPDGWERRSLENCVSTLETGNRPKGGVSGIEDGIPSIGAESIIGAGLFDFSKTKYVPDIYFNNLKKGVVQDRDVLVYKDGGRPGYFTPHVSFFGCGFPFGQMALNTHVYRIRGSSGISQEFLYYHLSSDLILSWMNNAGTGAAIPGIARKDLLRLPVIIPSSRIMEMFTEVTADFLTQILRLALTTKTLTQARDLLLPRLMNGEMVV